MDLVRLRGGRALKLDPAILRNGSPLYGVHFAFESRKVRSLSVVTTNEKQCWPKQNKGNSNYDLIGGCLLALLTRGSGGGR